MIRIDQQTKHLLALVAVSAVLIGLGLFAFYDIFFSDTLSEQRQALENKVFHFKKDDVVGFAVTAKGETTRLSYSNENGNAGWRIVSPVQDYTSVNVVELFLDALASVSWKEKIEGDEAVPERFGLDKPAVIVVARLRNGQQHTLRIGSLTALDGTDYALIDGSKEIFQTRTPLRFALERSTFDLRARLLLPVYTDQIEVIQVHAGPSHIHLRKAVDGTWSLGKPIARRADGAAVQKMLDAIDDAYITRFVTERVTPDESRRFGFGQPKLRLKLALKGFRHVEFLFSEVTDDAGEKKLLARRTDTTRVVEIPSDFLTPFQQEVLALRDRQVVHFDPSTVAILDFRLDDGAVRIERSVEGEGEKPKISWELKGLYPKPFSLARVESLLAAFAQLTASAFVDGKVDLAALGLSHARRTWILRDAQGRPLAALFAGREDGENTYVRFIDAKDDAHVFTVNTSALDVLPRRHSDLESWDPTRFLTPSAPNMTKTSSSPGSP
ncbi:MAG: DUF4340 domain-containing protein [Myxococcales bacterium]|nr:DUF4340 domain-containing protein [Myxococcales bacterium]